MGTFYEGDRVRLGEMRGGVVVRHAGKLRVRFHDAQTLLWLDHCVPDEGPDGRIYPNTWDLCEHCGNPTVSSFACVNCEARSRSAAETFARNEQRDEYLDAIAKGEPAFGVHVASSIRRHGRTVEQRCARCGVVLMRYIGDPASPPLYREGQLIERTYTGWGPTARVTDPTCTPIREAVTA